MPSRPRLRPRPGAAAAAAALVTLALAGCVPNAGSARALSVKMTDTGCAVSAATATSGSVAFSLTNAGTDVNEFEILADDKLRIVGEKENVTPGQTVSFVAQLEPGTYYTACKFQQVGAPVGLAEFTVTGDKVAVTGDTKKLTAKAVTGYVAYVRSQTAELLPAVTTFVAAYEKGDDSAARALYASTRAHYERIEPTAEAFGDLDPKIDYREVDATADGLSWTGFHRIEKDLWPPTAGALNADGADAATGWSPSTPAQRTVFGQGLIRDVQKLSTLVSAKSFSVTLADISNGAIGLLDEVASSKITGEEDWWSHTDLSDFAANVQGAQVAFGNVTALATASGSAGTKLVATITKEFAALDGLLARYGSIDAGFTPYDQVTDAQRKELSDQVNALAEPLSRLTHTVLGVAAG
ncbi:iron uptake system protein EfeO [Lysinimonas soli]|uniref:Iron uptake system protein EfeO n=1 Tax=Lysinimonas soli TaxID=1074233 RepID=A0ABW0NP85_9MICO